MDGGRPCREVCAVDELDDVDLLMGNEFIILLTYYKSKTGLICATKGLIFKFLVLVPDFQKKKC